MAILSRLNLSHDSSMEDVEYLVPAKARASECANDEVIDPSNDGMISVYTRINKTAPDPPSQGEELASASQGP